VPNRRREATAVDFVERGGTELAASCLEVTRVKQSIAELKRYSVYNRGGDKLGAIDDVVLDADDWSICYAVLRYDVAGEPAKLLGVALDALTLDSENECLVVDADGDALRRARGFDREAPPPRPDPLFKSLES
jgi:sporulation protein YlmC with PRC-barrel domain